MTDQLRNDEIRVNDLSNREDLAPTDFTASVEQTERRSVISAALAPPENRTNLAPDGPAAGVAVGRAKEEDLAPLFSTDEANNLRSKWDDVQSKFVDEPRQAVEQADHLIEITMKRLAEVFASERQELEHQWDRGNDVSTEDLRLALRRYRSFFSRLLRV